MNALKDQYVYRPMPAGETAYARAARYAQQHSHDLNLAFTTLFQLGLPTRITNDYVRQLTTLGHIEGDTLKQVNMFLQEKARDNHPYLRRLLHDIAEDALWRRNRAVIAIDPDLWRELGEVDNEDLFSGDVFGYLAMHDPFIFFPEPILRPTSDPQLTLYAIGVHVLGARPSDDSPLLGHDTVMLCSTSDPRMRTLHLKFLSVVIDAEGRERYVTFTRKPGEHIIDGVTSRVTIPVSRNRPLTFAELAELARLNWGSDEDDTELAELEGEDPAGEMVQLLRRTLGTIMYLCCDNADMVQRSAPRAGRKQRRRDPGELRPTVYEAGFTVGAALRQMRIERHAAAKSEPTGRTLRPHLRRAHFRRVRYGPGRALLSQPRFFPMTMVNAHLDDGEKVMVRPAKTTPPPAHPAELGSVQ